MSYFQRLKAMMFAFDPSWWGVRGCGRAEAPASRDRRRTGRLAPRHPRPRLQRRIMRMIVGLEYDFIKCRNLSGGDGVYIDSGEIIYRLSNEGIV